jgi:hypothetical protein
MSVQRLMLGFAMYRRSLSIAAIPALACMASTAGPNWPIDTDPQQQEAASPLVLVVRSFLR